MLTDYCPSRCIYCPYRTGAFAKPGVFLPAEWTLKAIDVMAEMGITHLQLSGGEPMLHPNIGDFVLRARQHGLQVNIISSGYVLSDKLARQLAAADLTSLGLSIDAFDAAPYQTNRGKPFEHAQRALDLALYMRSLKPDLWLGINCVITRYNVNHLTSLAMAMDRLGIASQYQLVNDFAESRENASLLPPLAELEHNVEALIELRAQGIKINNTPEYLRLIVRYAREQSLPPTFNCYLGLAQIVITPERTVQLCCMLPAPVKVDNPATLPAIWQSAIYDQQRQNIRERRCPQCWLLHFDVWK